MSIGRIKGITIEIGADVTKLSSALAGIDNIVRNTKQNLRDLQSALKLDPTNVTLIKDKHAELSREIESTKSKIEAEKEALRQLNEKLNEPIDMDHVEEFQKNARAAENLKIQIDLDTAALKELQSQGGTSLAAVGEQIAAIGGKLEETGRKISALGDTLTRSLTVPIAGAATAAVKTTADFDTQMSKVKAISGATGEEFDALRDKAREMGATTKFSATEAGEALQYMAMAGWEPEQMLEGLSGIMNLAAASEEDLGTTSDIVTDALTAFGMSAEDAGHFADVLAAAASKSNTDVSMLGESFKYVAPLAGAMGYSVEDVTTALGLMANAGIKADQGGTSLRNMLQRMAKPTKESETAMAALGLSLYDVDGRMYSLDEIMRQLRESFKDVTVPLDIFADLTKDIGEQLEAGTITEEEYNEAVAELMEVNYGAEAAEKARLAAMLGGARAMPGLLAIVNATEEDYNKLSESINQASDVFVKTADGSVMTMTQALEQGKEVVEEYNGAAEAMAATMQDNLGGELTKLKSALQELAISFGDILMPMIRDIVAKIQEFVDKLNSLDDEQKEQIIRIAAVVAAIGPLLSVLGRVMTTIGTVMQVAQPLLTMVGNLGTAAGTASGALAGIGSTLAAIAAPIAVVVATVGTLVLAFKHLWETNEDFRNKMTEIWDGLKEKFETFVQTVQEKVEAVMPTIERRIEGLKIFIDNFVTAVKALWETFCALLAPVFEGAWTAISGILSAVMDAMVGVLDVFIGLFTGNWDQMWTGIKEIFVAAVEAFTSILDGILTTLGGWADAFLGLFGTSLEEVGTKITTFATDAAQWFQDLWNDIVNGVSEFFAPIKDVIDAILNGDGDSVKNIFSNLIQSALTWGADLVANFAKGITDKVGAVKEGAEGVAKKVWDFLHFSKPEEGPLSDFDTYAPDMMLLFAEGIEAGMAKVEKAITDGLQNSILKKFEDFKVTLKGEIDRLFGPNGDILRTIRELSAAIQTELDTLFGEEAGILGKVKKLSTDILTEIDNLFGESGLLGKLKAFTEILQTELDTLFGEETGILGKVKQLSTDILTEINNLFGETGIMGKLKTFGTDIRTELDTLFGEEAGILGKVKKLSADILEEIDNLFGDDGIMGKLKTLREDIGKELDSLFGEGNGIMGKFKTFATGLLTELDNLLGEGSGILGKFKAFATAIKTEIDNLFGEGNGILGKFKTFATSIQKEIDKFFGEGEGIIGKTKKLAKDVLKEVTDLLTGSDGLTQKTEDFIKDITEKLEQFQEDITQKNVEFLKQIKKDTQEGLKAVRTVTKNKMENINKTVKNKLDNIKTKLKNFRTKANEIFDKIIEDAFTWGVDMMDNLIAGIDSKIGELESKIAYLASLIDQYLGFSEPEKGPLKDFHTFAPDMMDLFIKGIADNERALQRQLEKTFDFRDTITRASDLLMGLETSGAALQSTRALQAVNNNTTTVGDMNVSFQITAAPNQDINALARVIEQKLTSMNTRRSIGAI